MIKSLIRSIAVRVRNAEKWQIAAGVAWGVLLALVPLGNFFWIVLLLVSLFLRHKRILSLLVMAAARLFLPLFVMPIDALGWAALHMDALQPFFTSLYNMPFVPFTRFNNTLVAGGLAGGIILWLPVFFAVFGLLSLYRSIIAPKLKGEKRAASGKGASARENDEGGQG
ncbi:MAG: TIGR03546 family protein [Treponema sp.]|jgi:uncharacterized protein (TIGR03546 family)|nr:TIGR03546 family protein [Treponema sp.]